jgi:hypothetical protein
LFSSSGVATLSQEEGEVAPQRAVQAGLWSPVSGYGDREVTLATPRSQKETLIGPCAVCIERGRPNVRGDNARAWAGLGE